MTVLISSHILSEIEQMADKVGIIDKGVLVEELTMDEIRYRNRHYLKLNVSDIKRAIPILEKELFIHDFEIVNDCEMKIYDLDKDLGIINRMLVMNGVDVSELHVKKGNLEEYFLKLTGGVTIG